MMIKLKTLPYYLNVVYLSVMLLLSSVSQASREDWLQISNAPQCAADMSEPTQSVFLAVSFRDTALILKALAPQIQQDPMTFIQNGNKAFKIKLNLLTEKIIHGLDSGLLPVITTKDESLIQKSWEAYKNSAPLPEQTIEDLRCYQVNDINSYYSHLFIRGINQSTLTELAKQYKDNKSRINGCSSENIEANADFYPVFNYDFKVKDAKKWKQVGFDFWGSYKIYLSWAWRNEQSLGSLNQVYNKIFKSVPIEEQVVILSNGCKSLTRPECHSDFLSSTELRTLFTLDRKKLDLTSSTLEMRDNIMDNNDSVDQKAQQQLALQAAENKWVRSFQKSYLGFTQAHKDKLYEANKLMSSLTAQVGVGRFNQDLLLSLKDKTQNESLYYLCSEARLLGQEKPLSIFKFDLDFMRQQGSKLNAMLKFGLTVEEMIALYENISPRLAEVCTQFDQSLRDGNLAQENWSQYRAWYKNYLSRYKILQTAIENDEEVAEAVVIEKAPQNYVKDLCENAVDCARKVIEGVVNINKVLLHSKTFFRTEFVQAPLFNERAEKVACGLYDPWEAGRLNHKKLLADVGSSLLFGWTSLPIYLDVNFKPKELVSMNKMIEDGHVRFDVGFEKHQVQKSLSLNFGSFLNVPCSIQLSQTKNLQSESANLPYVFSGLSVSACKGNKYDHISSPQQQIDSFKKTPETDRSVCGQCAINFSQVVPLVAKNSFAPLRFLIRLAESLVRYNTAKNDDTINPRQFNINTKYLVQTYDKYNGIPEQCVSMLTRGLRCQSNMCEALAVKEFEVKTGLEVDSVSLSENTDSVSFGTYEKAYFKVKGCTKEISVPMNCQGNGSSFYMMSVSKYSLKSCQKELQK